MDPPLSVSLVDATTEDGKTREHPRVELQLGPEDIFTTAVGHPTKRTLAKWHVTSPLEVVEELLKLAGVQPEQRRGQAMRAITSVLVNDGRKEGSRSYGYRERKNSHTQKVGGYTRAFFFKGTLFRSFQILSTSVFFIFIMAVIMAKLWGTHVLFIVT